MQKYKFFWDGYLSNWHPSPFTIGEIKYVNAEQYMMHMKALLFNDQVTASKILKESNPKKIKALGREVKNFDSEQWDRRKVDLITTGLIAKFKQNPQLLEKLLAEDCDLFVEASPYDKIWGIGLSEAEARRVPEDEWPGENLLGLIITSIRDLLSR